MNRPLGVSILSVYSWIIGILAVVEGTVVILLSPGTPYLAAPVAVIMALGVFAVVLGACQIVFGYGAWGLRPWAWPFGLVLFVSSVPLDLATLQASTTASTVISILLTAVVVYYLLQRHIRRAFGRGGPADEVESEDPNSKAWPDGPPPWLDHA
jgi:uncharacterized membrane protein (DUF2068 family)